MKNLLGKYGDFCFSDNHPVVGIAVWLLTPIVFGLGLCLVALSFTIGN